MKRYDTITLIAEAPEARGVYEEKTDLATTVFCEVRSVGMRENYEALAHGRRPEVVFVLSQDFDYAGQKRVVWNGVTYNIIRTYLTEADEIELTAERMVQ